MVEAAVAVVGHRGQLYWCLEGGWQMLAEVGILDLKRKASKVCSFVAIQAMLLPKTKNNPIPTILHYINRGRIFCEAALILRKCLEANHS